MSAHARGSGSLLTLLLAGLAGCTELPTPTAGEIPVEIVLDVPSTLVVHDSVWLRAHVYDSRGRRIFGPPVRLTGPMAGYPEPLLKLDSRARDSVLVRGDRAGIAPVIASLESLEMAAESVTDTVRVGYSGVQISFPAGDSVIEVASPGMFILEVDARDSRGRRVVDGINVAVKPGAALYWPADLSRPPEIRWKYVAEGTDTLTVWYSSCLEPCVALRVVRVEFTPVVIAFPNYSSGRLHVPSLGDTVIPTPRLLDARGNYLRDASPVYGLEEPADSLVLDMEALDDGLIVARNEGVVTVLAREEGAEGSLWVSVDQRTSRFRVLDPPARYLVGPGASDTVRIEIQDARGNPLRTPDRSALFGEDFVYSGTRPVIRTETLDDHLALMTAHSYGESNFMVETSAAMRLDSRVRVIPEPDSVRALPAPEDPILSLGRGDSPLLGDIFLPGEALTATELNWTALDPTVATVDGWGFVTAFSNGVARFEGRMGASADTVSVTVQAPGG
jgi:hypothetical protein